MTDWHRTLAQTDGDSTFKVIIGVIFAAIWIISQIVSALNERRKKAPAPPPTPRVEPPPMPQQSRQRHPQYQPQQHQQRQGAEQKRQRIEKQRQKADRDRRAAEALAKLTRPEPPPMPQRNVPATRSSAQRAAAEAAEATPFEKQTADGSTKRERLHSVLRPKNLRKQFILTELLNKPVGLRDHEPTTRAG